MVLVLEAHADDDELLDDDAALEVLDAFGLDGETDRADLDFDVAFVTLSSAPFSDFALTIALTGAAFALPFAGFSTAFALPIGRDAAGIMNNLTFFSLDLL